MLNGSAAFDIPLHRHYIAKKAADRKTVAALYKFCSVPPQMEFTQNFGHSQAM